MSKWSTRINAIGPDGNIFSIIGTARKLLRQIGEPNEELEDMTRRAIKAGSYQEAVAVVCEYFPVILDRDDD